MVHLISIFRFKFSECLLTSGVMSSNSNAGYHIKIISELFLNTCTNLTVVLKIIIKKHQLIFFKVLRSEKNKEHPLLFWPVSQVFIFCNKCKKQYFWLKIGRNIVSHSQNETKRIVLSKHILSVTKAWVVLKAIKLMETCMFETLFCVTF